MVRYGLGLIAGRAEAIPGVVSDSAIKEEHNVPPAPVAGVGGCAVGTGRTVPVGMDMHGFPLYASVVGGQGGIENLQCDCHHFLSPIRGFCPCGPSSELDLGTAYAAGRGWD